MFICYLFLGKQSMNSDGMIFKEKNNDIKKNFISNFNRIE